MFFNDWLTRRQIYTPDLVGVTDTINGRDVTYAELNRRASALASWLRNEVGVRAGERVACISTNRIEYIALSFACGKIGAILAPLNYRLPEPALRQLIEDCTPRLLVFEDEWEALAKALRDERSVEQAVAMDGIGGICAQGFSASHFHAYDAGLEEVAMILYTSGTTGRSKGAMINWRQIHWNAVNTTIGLQLTQDDVSFVNSPLYHTGGWHVLFTPLMHLGGRLVLQKQFDPAACNDLIPRERLTILFGIPTTLRMMMDAPNFTISDFSCLRMVICGGEPCPIPVLRAFEEKGVPVRQGYGLTEAGPNCFSLPAEDARRKAGSVGFPNFHIGTRIVKDDGSEAAAGEVGELLMRGPHVFSGYWNDPAATRAALEDGWVRTGDLFKRDAEGYHYVVGRKKDMFISGGENVYPVQVEKVLDEHPAVARSAVVGVPDARWGETGCAFVALRAGQTIEPGALRSWCRQFLAGFQCPGHFLMAGELPIGPSGKVDKLALHKLALRHLERNVSQTTP